MKNKAIIILSLFLILLLSACTVNQNLSIFSASTKFTAQPFLNDLVKDLSSWTQSDSDNDVLDQAILSVAYNLDDCPNTENIFLEKVSELSYNIGVDFDNLQEFIDNLAQNTEQNILSITENKDSHETQLDLNISLENWNLLANIIPVLKDPNLEVYGPVYNNPPYDNRSEEDYYYMIDFIFGSGSEDIKNSLITINFEAPNEIINTNGTLISPNIVTFKIPLIDLILLHQPIHFYCIW